MSRRLIFAALCGLIVAAGVAYIGLTGARTVEPPRLHASGAIDAAPAPAGEDARLLFVSAAFDASNNQLGSFALRGQPAQPAFTGLRCERVHFRGGAGICLAANRGVITTYQAHVLDAGLRVRASLPLVGTPSRARVSPDGRRASTTVFVSGDSYTASGFSTRTTIIDLDAASPIADLETFTIWRDGARFSAVDFNFWGVTFAGDSNRFYATLASGGTIYLIEGDVNARRARVVTTGIECPSLSPDGTRIAFKKKMSASRWNLAVLDLATMRQWTLADTRNVDDQAEWLDDDTVAYALPAEDTAGGADIWAARVSGASPPRLLVQHGVSPTVVR
jgi:hypothetical protein